MEKFIKMKYDDITKLHEDVKNINIIYYIDTETNIHPIITLSDLLFIYNTEKYNMVFFFYIMCMSNRLRYDIINIYNYYYADIYINKYNNNLLLIDITISIYTQAQEIIDCIDINDYIKYMIKTIKYNMDLNDRKVVINISKVKNLYNIKSLLHNNIIHKIIKSLMYHIPFIFISYNYFTEDVINGMGSNVIFIKHIFYKTKNMFNNKNNFIKYKINQIEPKYNDLFLSESLYDYSYNTKHIMGYYKQNKILYDFIMYLVI